MIDAITDSSISSTVTYTPEFTACLDYDGQHLLVLAGAGCGKTTVLTNKIAKTIKENFEARILAVTFTNNAATTMRERLTKMIGEDAMKNVTIRTIHSLGSRLLYNYTVACGRKPGYSILTPHLAKSFYTLFCDDERDRKKLAKGLSSWKNNITECPTYQLSLLWKEYERILVEKNMVDFDDLVLLPLAMLKKNPHIAEFEARKYTHIFVDEYQDTSPEQIQFLDHLTGENTIITCVGDDAQSIYSFRGADPSCITNFEHKYPGAKVLTLSKNYRSTQKICDIGNATLFANPMKYRKTLYAASGENGQEVTFTHYSKPVDEAEKVASQIADITKNHPKDNIAVIYRMHKIGKNIAQELSKQGISHTIIGFNATDSVLVELYFHTLATVLTLVSKSDGTNLLGEPILIENKKNTAPLEGILLSSVVNIDGQTVNTLNSYSDTHRLPLFTSVYNAQVIPDIIPTRQKILKEVAGDLIKIALEIDTNGFSSDVHDMIVDFLTKRTEKALKGYDKEDINAEWTMVHQNFTFLTHKPNINQVWQYCNTFLTENTIDTKLVSHDENTAESDPRVQLSTVHHVKGAEFDHVFIIGVSDKILPMYFTRLADMPLDQIMEERRLFHVAVTRGKKTVTVTSSGKPSVFIEELHIITSPAEETSSLGFIPDKLLKKFHTRAKFMKKSGT